MNNFGWLSSSSIIVVPSPNNTAVLKIKFLFIQLFYPTWQVSSFTANRVRHLDLLLIYLLIDVHWYPLFIDEAFGLMDVQFGWTYAALLHLLVHYYCFVAATARLIILCDGFVEHEYLTKHFLRIVGWTVRLGQIYVTWIHLNQLNLLRKCRLLISLRTDLHQLLVQLRNP